jgi:hypothetical protein
MAIVTSVSKVKMADVTIPEAPEATPRPPYTPETDDIKKMWNDLLSEHRRLKGILDKYGKKSKCVPLDIMKDESGLTEDRIAQHMKIFDANDYTTEVEEGVVCGRGAIRKLKSELQEEL